MKVRFFFLIVIFLVIPAISVAQMYRCRTADGKYAYLDKPINLSDDCVLLKEPPSTQNQLTPAPYSPPEPQKVRASKARSVKDFRAESGMEAWTVRATDLVNEYRDAAKRRHRESNIFDKRQAIRDVKSIKAEKKSLQAELQGSSLSRKQRNKIQTLLQEIPM